jgi:hypothetical protein
MSYIGDRDCTPTVSYQMCVLREEDATAQRRPFPLGRWVSLVPSLSDVAFLMPILVLFRCATGVGWLLSDSDTGWHIRTGEWILNKRRIPSTDLFSFTRTGQPWFAWEWLSDVSMAAAHSHFGLGGVALYLQKYGQRVPPSPDRDLRDQSCNGCEHDTLARPTTPRHSVIRGRVLLRSRPGGEN